MSLPRTIRHCRACGAAVQYRLPDDGDTHERAICPVCATIHYENPLMVVGTLPVWGDQVLLCRRAIEPRRGLWTLPAGFMELGETAEAGALRETAEEAGAPVELGALRALVSLPRVGQVHAFFDARLTALHFDPGHETLEVRLFAQSDLPWDELAFRTVSETLRRYFDDRRAGVQRLHVFDVV